MYGFRNAFCWAVAIIGVAVAGVFEVIDQASTTSLLIALPAAGSAAMVALLAVILIALPVAGWMAVSGRGSCPRSRRV